MNHYRQQPTNSGPSFIPTLPDEIFTAPDQDGAEDAPPNLLPKPVIPKPPFHLRALRGGCYYLAYVPNSSVVNYYGTMRVEKPSASQTTASGDLYSYARFVLPPAPIPRPPAVSASIPIFPRNLYRYYLRVTRILEGLTFGQSFTLGFERHRLDLATGAWFNEGAFTALMTWTTPPAGYPGDYLTGQVKNAANNIVGTLTMGWVSKYLRKAIVEIDTVPGSEAPLNNGAGVDWQSIGDQIGWEINAFCSSTDAIAPSGDSWSDAEMHAAMLARRDSANLDTQWRYHILSVRQLDSTPRGIMYDNGGTDSNRVPREGIGISTHWMIPNTAEWGLVRNMRFGAALQPHFRTALHEIGHAMSLFHNTVDNGIMNTTDVIAASATPTSPFPTNILWSHAANDRKRLRHRPDVYVRPGGTPFGGASDIPVSPDDEAQVVPGLALYVTPLLDSVPLGAPVRINLALVNDSDYPQQVPAKISLKSDFLSGCVTGPTGVKRGFSPLIYCVEDHEMTTLANPGDSISGALTLLRGVDGALFPTANVHEITVDVAWEVEGRPVKVSGCATVMITPVVDKSHADSAHQVLTTPDVHLVLALGGDHLDEGIAAVHSALKNKTLRPHFAYTEARRVGTRFMKRAANAKAAAELLEDAVLSYRELDKAANILKNGKDASSKKTAKVLQAQAGKVGASDATIKTLKSI